MVTYTIKKLKTKDFTGIEKANIDNILWGGTYKPECFAQVIYVEDEGFYAKLSCKEADPLVTYKKGDFSDDVCDDRKRLY